MKCWEFMNCKKERLCGAYPAHGRMCWLVSSTQCKSNNTGDFAKEVEDCTICPWYNVLKDGADEDIQHWFERENGQMKTGNCWEFWSCGMEKDDACTAFPGYGSKCWMVAGSYAGANNTCTGRITGKFAKIYGHHLGGCEDCPWYLHIHDKATATAKL